MLTGRNHPSAWKKRLAWIEAVWVLAMFTGCASPPKSVEIRGEADQVLNRDAGGNSLSVAIRLYQLKGADEFSRLTFDMLANGRPDAEPIVSDLLEKNEVVLVPGGGFASSAPIRDDTKFVGVLAYFRQPDPRYWRFLVEADKVRREGFSFKAKDCYLVIVSPKPALIPGQPADAIPQYERVPPVTLAPGTASRHMPSPSKSVPTAATPKP